MRLWAVMFVFAVIVVTVPAHAAPTVVIHVDDDAAPGGNGTGRFPLPTCRTRLLPRVLFQERRSSKLSLAIIHWPARW